MCRLNRTERCSGSKLPDSTFCFSRVLPIFACGKHESEFLVRCVMSISLQLGNEFPRKASTKMRAAIDLPTKGAGNFGPSPEQKLWTPRSDAEREQTIVLHSRFSYSFVAFRSGLRVYNAAQRHSCFAWRDSILVHFIQLKPAV